MRQFWSWTKRLAHWIARPTVLWIALAVVLASALIALRPGVSDQVVRLTGLVLQLLGIGTVIWGIELTRRLFNHPTLLTMAGEWLKEFPPYRGRAVTAVGAGAAGFAAARARAYVTSNPPPNATVDQRLTSLEANVGFLNKRIDGLFQELDQSVSAHSAALDRERQDRIGEDAKIAAKLETSGTGGLHISAIGALWLIIGVILSTAAPEIAKWLN